MSAPQNCDVNYNDKTKLIKKKFHHDDDLVDAAGFV